MKEGYTPGFLGPELALPKFDSATKGIDGDTMLDYIHFSILYSRQRKSPIFTAVNIDGDRFVPNPRGSDKWMHEKRAGLLKTDHLDDDFYKQTAKNFHRGHVVRRLDPCWGECAEQAADQTFHYTNACAQHKDFNPRIWLELETSLLEKGALAGEQKITVFSGPVLSGIDKPFIKKVYGGLFFIPSHFWKVIVWKKSDGLLYAVGFIQSQKDLINNFVDLSYGQEKVFKDALEEDYFENITFKNNATYQVSIDIIQKLTGLSFPFDAVRLPKVKNDYAELKAKEHYREANVKGNFRDGDVARPKIEVLGMVLE